MTKTQLKKRLQDAIDALQLVQETLEEIENEATETAEEIEPYEGKDDLTTQQEERREWFENVASILCDAKDEAESRRCELEEIIEE